MELNAAIFDEFLRITGRDISRYFVNALNFFNSDYNTIVKYYSGALDNISSTPFSNFDALEEENKQVFAVFQQNSRQFNNLKWWLLVEQMEEIDNRLKTLRNINKWSRSSLTKVGYDPNIQAEYVLKQNQTIENVSKDLMQSDKPNDDWADIAIQNVLEEEDYTTEGGNDLKLRFNRGVRNLRINCVVDVINDKSIYGKDLNRRIQFDSDENDLEVLGYDDTIRQAVEILSNLRKNDNPDNPNAGLQSTLVAGSNRAMFNAPVIIRQFNQTFAGDDTLKNFNINGLGLDQDNLTIDYVVQTRLDETFSDQIIF
ncbi:MAG: hypothetical protein H7Y42_13970 [Chitinophagaceae bacterium]|nr:hypothetical protein [Chitinophagaceae bacterium]